MGRPKLTEQRGAEILDAFERCVAQFGVEGATLERVAQQAGLARALIRHHVGNRDALLDALVDRVVEKGTFQAQAFADQLPVQNRTNALLGGLFGLEYGDAIQMRVVSALLLAMNDRPKLAARLRGWTLEFVAWLREELSAEFPNAHRNRINTVATGIATLYFSIDSITAMGEMQAYRKECLEAAQLLVGTLNL